MANTDRLNDLAGEIEDAAAWYRRLGDCMDVWREMRSEIESGSAAEAVAEKATELLSQYMDSVARRMSEMSDEMKAITQQRHRGGE